MFNPTVRYVENGYDFNETSPEWKEACRNLPCFSAVWWPDYSTEVIEETINGEPIVIQLWIGWCQKFLGRDDFPAESAPKSAFITGSPASRLRPRFHSCLKKWRIGC